MKKTAIISFALILGTLLVCSCVQPLEPSIRNGNSMHRLNVTVSCQSPATKAYLEGENKYNENTINHIDWFVFRDTSESTKPWLSGRVPFTDKNDGNTQFTVTSLEMDDYLDDYPDGKGYVLTIANYPSEDHSVYKVNDQALSFSEIRAMEFVTEQLGALHTNAFTPLNDFVMTSYATPFNLKENANATSAAVTVNAKLHRLAAKISLNINIVPYIDEIKAYVSGLDTTRIDYVQTWYPNVSGIRAYMTYANKHTTLTPVTVTTEADKTKVEEYSDEHFFTYYNRGFIIDTPIATTTAGDSIVTGSPFYSYPMKWETSDPHAPFIKIILKWEARKEEYTKKENEGHYISHTTGIPHMGDTVVVNTHARQGQFKFSQNFYYKISLPSTLNVLQSNVWTKINLDLAVLGGVDEEQTVQVIGRYFVVDWNDPGVLAGGDLTAGKYLGLSTERDTFYIYGGNSIKIPVRSSHQLDYTIISREARVGGVWTTTPRKADAAGTAINISNRGNVTIAEDGRSSITFTNTLDTDFSSDDLDCYPLRFTIDLKHVAGSGGLTTSKRIYIVQYPSIYIEQIPGDNTFVNGFYGHLNVNGAGTYYYRGTSTSMEGTTTAITGHNTSASTSSNIRVSYGNMTRNTTDEQNLTIISVSAFNENSKTYTVSGTGAGTYSYIIADPRINTISSSVLLDYNTNYTDDGDNTTTAWPSADIKVGSMATDNPNNTPGRNFIAPRFMISSTWGRNPGMNGSITFDMAQRRCATYQEAGYPAGRWRLPTEAECAFIAVLQNRHFISTMFNSNTAYALSNGRGITVSGDSGSIGTSIRSLRCVYDLWYWGDDPFPGAEYTYVIAPGDTKLN